MKKAWLNGMLPPMAVRPGSRAYRWCSHSTNASEAATATASLPSVAYLGFCEGEGVIAEGARLEALEMSWGVRRGYPLPPGRRLCRVLCPSPEILKLICGSKWAVFCSFFVFGQGGHRPVPRKYATGCRFGHFLRPYGHAVSSEFDFVQGLLYSVLALKCTNVELGTWYNYKQTDGRTRTYRKFAALLMVLLP